MYTLSRQGRQPAASLPIAALLALAIAAPTSADDVAVSVLAEHVFAADADGTLVSGAGLFPDRSPDALTAMASTTKVMSLIVTLDALEAGVVDLDDVVTIGLEAAQTGGSSMRSDSLPEAPDGLPLQIGERLRLEDLMFGMMIPSGNNATMAIAQHVAEGYAGDLGSVDMFVGFMNDRAERLGLTHTHYANPTGFDAALHFTTARELARLWEVGMADPQFRRFVRPQTWVAQGTFLGSTTIKTYTMTKAGNYPGIEGHKNGISPNCSGANDECFVGSARRIGRRITIAGMQADGWIGGSTGDAADAWDFAFGRLFHPESRGSSALVGAATKLAVVCPSAGRAVSLSLPVTGKATFASYATNVTAKSYLVSAKVSAPQSSIGPTAVAQDRDIDAIALTSTQIVTATRVVRSTEVRLWSISQPGAPTSVASLNGRTTGSAYGFELVRLSSSMFVTISRTTTNTITIRTYQRNVKGISLLKTYPVPLVTNVLEVDGASAPGQQGLRFVAAIRRSGKPLLVEAWSVNPVDGSVAPSGVQAFNGVEGAGLSIVPAPVEAVPGEVLTDTLYAIGLRRTNGTLAIVYARVVGAGTLDGLWFSPAPSDQISSAELAPFGSSGILAITRLSTGTIKARVFESYRIPDGSTQGMPVALPIAVHTSSLSALEPEVCQTPTTVAEGQFISGFREGSSGSVRIRGWQVAPRP